MILKEEKIIINKIKKVIASGSKKLHEPIFFGNEKKYLAECIKSSYVSSVGRFVNKFEKKLCKFTKSPHSVALVNATSAKLSGPPDTATTYFSLFKLSNLVLKL